MNISKQYMSGKCDEKCSFSFQYTTSSNCVAQNFGSFISLTYDKTSQPPVTFNSLHYDVQTIEIYKPSIHSFTNGPADAEIVIQHTSLQSGSPLLVCIPIMSYGVVSSEGSLILDQIVDAIVSNQVSQFSDNNPIRVPITNYSLNSIVPNTSFFYYISPTANANIIVYDIGNAIWLDPSKLAGLTPLLNVSADPFQPGDSLYYNASGSNEVRLTDDNIYIDCSPTGNTRETTEVPFKKSNANEMWNIFFNPATVLLGATIGFILIIIVVYTVFKFIVGDKMDSAFLNDIQSKLKADGGKSITESGIYKSVNKGLYSLKDSVENKAWVSSKYRPNKNK
jgi:hypothetical protein